MPMVVLRRSKTSTRERLGCESGGGAKRQHVTCGSDFCLPSINTCVNRYSPFVYRLQGLYAYSICGFRFEIRHPFTRTEPHALPSG